MLEEVYWAHFKHFESRLDLLNSAITSLTKNLACEGTRHGMECKEDLVHLVHGCFQEFCGVHCLRG